MLSKAKRDGYSIEEYTPKEIWSSLGPIDFDPCKGDHEPIGLIHNWTKEDDGLFGIEWPKELFGFVNPPFDQKEAVIEVCHNHGNNILLLPHAASAVWLHDLISKCEYWFLFKGRITFNGAYKTQAKFSTALYCFGDEAVNRVRNSGLNGTLVRRA